MTGYCVQGNHQECPDTKKDTYACSCPCHLYAPYGKTKPIAKEVEAAIQEANEQRAT